MAKAGEYTVGAKHWKASHNCWYCMVQHPDGRRHERRLDPDDDKAENVRQKLIDEMAEKGVPSLECSVDHLVQSFLTYAKDNNAEATYKWYAHFLLAFAESPGMGKLRVRDLKLSHVNRWLSKNYPVTGNSNTRHDAISCLKRLFNWAVDDMEYLPRNPLAKLKKPRRTHRDVCPTMEQWNQVLKHYDPGDPFRDFLSVLIDTGARPQELRVVEARQVDLKAQPTPLISFADGEIPGKQFGRKMKLTERAVGILQRLALKQPEGPLFRNEAGRPWTKDALNCRFRRLKKTAKLPFKVSCYAARHSLATDLLENGASAGAVSEMLGHRDPTVVLRFYGKHIDQRSDHLQGLLNKTRPPESEPPESKPDTEPRKRSKGKGKGTLPITKADVERAKKARKKRDAG